MKAIESFLTANFNRYIDWYN